MSIFQTLPLSSMAQGQSRQPILTQGPKGKRRGGAPNSFSLPIVFKPISLLAVFQPIDFLTFFFFFKLINFSGFTKEPISFRGGGYIMRLIF